MEIKNSTRGGCAARAMPDQIHVALASSSGALKRFDGMAVSWSTGLRAAKPTLFWALQPEFELGDSGVTAVAAERTSHVLCNFHHHAVITQLPPDTTVYYRVGNTADAAESKEWSFKSAPADDAPFSVSVFGDLAYGSDGKAVPTRHRLETLKDANSYDFVWHLGDIAYADDSFLHDATGFSYERRYNDFMNDMQNVSATMPYMVAPGNHESECHSPACFTSPTYLSALSNFSAYNARWRMPAKESGGKGLQMWSSFNYGLVHFVSWNSETDFPNAVEEHHGDSGVIPAGGFAPKGELMRWLEADLAAAHANRAQRPWVIVGSHRQLYLPPGGVQNDEVVAAVEELFRTYKVDAHFSGHEHNYGRTYPMYRRARSSNDSSHTYVDPSTPFYIVAGGAGCDEGLDDTVTASVSASGSSSGSTSGSASGSSSIDPAAPGLEFASARTRARARARAARRNGTAAPPPPPSPPPPPPSPLAKWTASVDTTSWGTGILHVLNRTHLKWEYIESVTGDVLDTLSIVQHAHA